MNLKIPIMANRALDKCPGPAGQPESLADACPPRQQRTPAPPEMPAHCAGPPWEAAVAAAARLAIPASTCSASADAAGGGGGGGGVDVGSGGGSIRPQKRGYDACSLHLFAGMAALTPPDWAGRGAADAVLASVAAAAAAADEAASEAQPGGAAEAAGSPVPPAAASSAVHAGRARRAAEDRHRPVLG